MLTKFLKFILHRTSPGKGGMIGTIYPDYGPYLLEIVWLLLAMKSIIKY